MSAPAIPYVGSRISLISKSGIRYEGLLYNIDKDSTVALQNVRSFGTEGRRKDGEIPPSNNLYDYIIFRGTDIKALKVCEPPPMPTMHHPPPNDPAIIAMNQQMPMGYPHMHPGVYQYYNSPYAPMYPSYYGGYGSQPQQNSSQMIQGQQNRLGNPQPQQSSDQTRRTSGHQYGAQISSPTSNVEAAPQKSEDLPVSDQESPQADENDTPQPKDSEEQITETNSNVSSEVSTSPQPSVIQEPVEEQATETIQASEREKPRAYASAARQTPFNENRGQKPRNTNNGRGSVSATVQTQQPRQNVQGSDRRQGNQVNQGQQTRRPPPRGAPARYHSNRPTNSTAPVQMDEFDFEKANLLFDKDKLKEEIIKAAEDTNAEASPAAQALLATKSYDKTTSFFDTLSCEATDKLAEEANDRRTYAEQRRLNAETFGIGNMNKGGRGGGHHTGPRSNYAPRRPHVGGQQQQHSNNTSMQANRQQAKKIFVVCPVVCCAFDTVRN
eukprot:TRINITY_DN1492_c0_g1_i2.p1 TRINITY_DN1492_c0_g1~~TRINITY_DN1492_c0_g1_i2.p1  ORF type:complete len:497 (+),score=65.18 TRINITY_DN1492_c0_g1_i2:116-1606(+)